MLGSQLMILLRCNWIWGFQPHWWSDRSIDECTASRSNCWEVESEWSKQVAGVASEGLSCTLPLLGSFSTAWSSVGELLSSAIHLGHDVLFHHGAVDQTSEPIMNLLSWSCCDGESCLSIWLHLELSKTQTVGYTYEGFFLIKQLEVGIIFNPELRQEVPPLIRTTPSAVSLYKGQGRRKLGLSLPVCSLTCEFVLSLALQPTSLGFQCIIKTNCNF